MNEEKSLQEQVERLLSIGIPPASVIKAMLDKGFSADEIETAFRNIPAPPPPPAPDLSNEAPLEEQVQRLASIGIDRRTIRAAMLKKGFDSAEVQKQVDSIPLPPPEPESLKRKIYTAISACALILLAFVLIPVNVTHNYDILLAFLLGAGFGVSTAMFFTSFKPQEFYGLKIFGGILGFIAFSVFFLVHSSKLEAQELEKYGKLTSGIIVDGESRSSRRGGNIAHVYVNFKTDQDKEYRAKVSVGKHEFERFYQNQEVFLLYSSRYPLIVKIINSPAELKKYLKE